MGGVVHLESQGHVLVHHSVLVDNLDLLSWISLNLFAVVDHVHESVCCWDAVAVLGVWEEDPDMLREALKGI